jgi:RNA polymerase sigma-70 factor, ECF subfamily
MEGREERWAAAMRAALDGDAGAYERLLGEVAAMLRGLLRARLARLGSGPDDAEDVLQEVLLAVHRKRDSWDRARPFLPWLHAIAEYKAIDAARRIGKARRRTVDAPVEEMADWLPAPPRREMALAVADPERAIASLPARERGIVAALGIEGISVRGAAARFAISEVAVRVAFSRGLARLARLAGGDGSAGRAGRSRR